MKTKDEVLQMIKEIKEDERLSYQTASVFSNAPLALIQCGLTARLHALEEIAEVELSKVPLKNKN